MTDPLWVLIAIGIACTGLALRSLVRRRFGRNRLGRLAGALLGWYGYFLALSVGTIQTNGGWHAGRGTNIETRSTWSEIGLFYAILALVLGVGSFIYLEHDWRRRFGERQVDAFPRRYVKEILEREGDSTSEQCRRTARSLRRKARKTRQPLPPRLAAFVARYLDRTT